MAIDVGVEAPDFELKDQTNQDIRLSSYRGSRNVLLVFYPFAFTRICQGELCAVRDNLNDFVNDSTQVLSVSVDSPPVHRAWAAAQGYEFPLLADFWPHGEVAMRYGVFNAEHGYANRGTFVIDKAGVVRFAEEYAIGHTRDQEAWRAALATL